MMCQKKDSELKLDEHALGQVDTFKYLGCISNHDGNYTTKVTSRIVWAKTALPKKKPAVLQRYEHKCEITLTQVFVWSVATIREMNYGRWAKLTWSSSKFSRCGAGEECYEGARQQEKQTRN